MGPHMTEEQVNEVVRHVPQASRQANNGGG
jgi:hypothetical protein